MRPLPRATGFTLVELIMVIALAALVAVMIGVVMSRPMQSFTDMTRRAELVDLAATALNRMSRDIRLAVPNSVRQGSGGELELLRAPAGGRYRANLLAGVRQDPPACSDTPPCEIAVLDPLPLHELDLSEPLWMVIYNIGGSGAGNSVWPPEDSASSVISPRTQISRLADGLSLDGVADFRFRYASPQHRFYLADRVVGYRCAAGRIERKEFDSLQQTYSYANAAVLVDHVDCSRSRFEYVAGANTSSGLVTLQLTLSEQGESISLLQQVHIDNAP